MKLEILFQSAVDELRSRGVHFAVAGGFAAGLYRTEPRLTVDIDFAVAAKECEQLAIEVVESLGLKAGTVREADLAGGPLFAIRKRSTPPCMVVGRLPGNLHGEGVDVLLPTLGWVEAAVERAQDNEVDFGFGAVPTITLEDSILSKLFALRTSPMRAKDIDDLQSIFAASHEIDMAFLAGQMKRFALIVPQAAEPFLPEWLVKLSRDVLRSTKPPRR